MSIEFPDESSEANLDEPKQQNIQIDVTREFQRDLRELKRYRSIHDDLQVVINELESGNFVGEQLVGIGENYLVFKARVRNRDIQKGKSSGYRLIYQLESPTSILLLAIYSKSDRKDISAKEVRAILKEFYDK